MRRKIVISAALLIAVLAVVLAIVVSGLSGLLPAVRASQLDPVAAIRYE